MKRLIHLSGVNWWVYCRYPGSGWLVGLLVCLFVFLHQAEFMRAEVGWCSPFAPAPSCCILLPYATAASGCPICSLISCFREGQLSSWDLKKKTLSVRAGSESICWHVFFPCVCCWKLEKQNNIPLMNKIHHKLLNPSKQRPHPIMMKREQKKILRSQTCFRTFKAVYG